MLLESPIQPKLGVGTITDAPGIQLSVYRSRTDFGNDPAAGSPTATLLRLLLLLAEEY